MADATRENPANNTVVGVDKKKLGSSVFLGRRGLLVVLSAHGFGKTCLIDKPVTVVGRHGDCDLSIPDPLVSRRHCSISADEQGEFYLEDLNSTNSTYLNTAMLKAKTRLQYGDRILVGDSVVRFFIEEATGKK